MRHQDPQRAARALPERRHHTMMGHRGSRTVSAAPRPVSRVPFPRYRGRSRERWPQPRRTGTRRAAQRGPRECWLPWRRATHPVKLKERKKSQKQRDEISSFFITSDHQKPCTEKLISKNTETKQMEEVTHLEALLFSAVLESCVDQLAIIGYIIPVSYEGKTELTDEIEEMTQEELDINNPELASAKQESGETVTSTAPKDTEHKEQQGKTEDEKSSKKRTTRAAEKLRKIQADRQYASDVITLTIKRMEKFGTFNSLKDANEREKARRSKFFDILSREEKAKKEIKSLQKQLQDVKKETEEDLQNRDKVIDSLKDNLLEQTSKLNTESYYLKKNTDLQVHLTQKKCSNAEKALEKEIQNLKSKIDDEIQVHKETEIFLKQQYQKVKEKLEYWMEKYKKDTEAKDQELEDLKVLKAENLEAMQRYAKECLAFQATIIIDRTEKEMKRKQIEQEALEHKSRIKLQAWWKGTMVRKFLGRYQELEKFLKERAAEREAEKEKAGKKK